MSPNLMVAGVLDTIFFSISTQIQSPKRSLLWILQKSENYYCFVIDTQELVKLWQQQRNEYSVFQSSRFFEITYDC
jgi:hypothetical protein